MKSTEKELLESLVNEGLGKDEDEVLEMLEDMGISLEEILDGEWY